MSGPAITRPRVVLPRPLPRPPLPPAREIRRRILPREVAARRALPLSLAGCVVLAALTLLAPSAPTYDPWAWIVWGREIVHLDLSTAYGPSWKPLPVALTAVFALFGNAAPALWVLAARAGALAGALFAFRLARRLGGTPAGVAAAAALLLAPWYVRSAALANSEGLQVAFALAAIERSLAGRRGQAFALALGLGLLRPEAWPFIGAFGLWLVWRDRGRLLGVAAGLASLPVVWLVPEWLGSGDLLRAAHRAQQPVGRSPAFSDDPVVDVLREGWFMLDRPVRFALVVAVTVGVARRDRRFAVLAGLAIAWTLLVAAMTANGYSGNQRYLMVPAAVAIVLAAAGLAIAGRAVLVAAGKRARLPLPRGRWLTATVAATTLGMAWWLAGPWLAPTRETIRATSWQARLVGQLGPVVDRAGGAAALRSCGTPVTGAYLVPAVAWRLHVHLSRVQLVAVRPGVVFRVHTILGAAPIPTLAPLGDLHGLRTLARSPDWRVVAACGAP